jgi:antitoxin component YwqK of YwqJK toxin-antitoxin module
MLGEVLMSYEEIKYFDGSFKRLWRDENGKYHRELAPTIIWYYPDGSIKAEYFYINGRQHRELAPAVICYYPDASIKAEYFYFNGNYLGEYDEGFWGLSGLLTEERRRSPEILKYLVRFS